MKYVVIIPARYESSRLPGKPLIFLNGIPMIVRTYQQCIKAVPKELVYVATDDARIKSYCDDYRMPVVMTSNECLTGTDRVAEAAQQIDADIYINVQGDEPLFNPDDLTLLVKTAEEHPNDVINGYCEFNDEDLYRSPSIPKVVKRPDGRLLYMSRAGVPANKNNTFVTGHRQVCAYAFPKESLTAFIGRDKTELEAIEDIEILRFLELGWEVQMVQMSDQSISVDTPEDVDKVRSMF